MKIKINIEIVYCKYCRGKVDSEVDGEWHDECHKAYVQYTHNRKLVYNLDEHHISESAWQIFVKVIVSNPWKHERQMKESADKLGKEILPRLKELNPNISKHLRYVCSFPEFVITGNHDSNFIMRFDFCDPES